jgi:1-aminocyclopropane-1-carboxylate deaminase/D-cysteine desulfhydrase-like pyridoxal-dependent ACC family enzyme
MAKEGAFAPQENVLYIYSGGAGGLFAVDMKL